MPLATNFQDIKSSTNICGLYEGLTAATARMSIFPIEKKSNQLGANDVLRNFFKFIFHPIKSISPKDKVLISMPDANKNPILFNSLRRNASQSGRQGKFSVSIENVVNAIAEAENVSEPVSEAFLQDFSSAIKDKERLYGKVNSSITAIFWLTGTALSVVGLLGMFFLPLSSALIIVGITMGAVTALITFIRFIAALNRVRNIDSVHCLNHKLSSIGQKHKQSQQKSLELVCQSHSQKEHLEKTTQEQKKLNEELGQKLHKSETEKQQILNQAKKVFEEKDNVIKSIQEKNAEEKKADPKIEPVTKKSLPEIESIKKDKPTEEVPIVTKDIYSTEKKAIENPPSLVQGLIQPNCLKK
jgi:hypothetical protein